jgi:hypothetical protein
VPTHAHPQPPQEAFTRLQDLVATHVSAEAAAERIATFLEDPKSYGAPIPTNDVPALVNFLVKHHGKE